MRDYFRIDAIRLENFRCFGRLEIEFNRGPRVIQLDGRDVEVGPLTVIVARNGQGKSTVLDAVRVAFGTFTSAFDYPSPVHIAKSDIRIASDRNVSGPSFALPVTVEARGMLESESVVWSRKLTKEKGRTSTKDARVATAFGKRLKEAVTGADGEAMVLPLIAYYGTARLWKDHREADKDRPLLKPRDFGYDYCMEDNSNYKAVYRWMTNALLAEMTAHQIQAEPGTIALQLQAIRAALSGLLAREGLSDFLHYNYAFRELAVTQRHESVGQEPENISIPVSMLSDGVRAVFSMAADIAFRCTKLNPQLGETACRETPGIILIDEVDQHLHPAWQQTVLDTLQAAFPMMQFVVTTHSPQVVSSVPNECVRIVGRNGSVSHVCRQTQGVESQDLLAEVFGTSPAPQDNPFVHMLAEYARLESDGLADTEEARNLYARLADHYSPDYPPLLRIELHRRFARQRKGSAHA